MAPPKNLAFDDAKASKDLVLPLLSTNPKNKTTLKALHVSPLAIICGQCLCLIVDSSITE